MKDKLNNIAEALQEAGYKLQMYTDCAFIGAARKDLRAVAKHIEKLEGKQTAIMNIIAFISLVYILLVAVMAITYTHCTN